MSQEGRCHWNGDGHYRQHSNGFIQLFIATGSALRSPQRTIPNPSVLSQLKTRPRPRPRRVVFVLYPRDLRGGTAVKVSMLVRWCVADEALNRERPCLGPSLSLALFLSFP